MTEGASETHNTFRFHVLLRLGDEGRDGGNDADKRFCQQMSAYYFPSLISRVTFRLFTRMSPTDQKNVSRLLRHDNRMATAQDPVQWGHKVIRCFQVTKSIMSSTVSVIYTIYVILTRQDT